MAYSISGKSNYQSSPPVQIKGKNLIFYEFEHRFAKMYLDVLATVSNYFSTIDYGGNEAVKEMN